MDPADERRRGIDRRNLLRALGAGALAPLAGDAVVDTAGAVDAVDAVATVDARGRPQPPGEECVIDSFEDGILAAYDADGPKDNWAVVPMRGVGNQLQFQGGDGADIRSFEGLENYPRRGEPFSIRFGAYGGWDGYAMFSFGIDPSNHQHRYELEFEPAADEIRLEYSRAPQDEETIASTTAHFERDREYVVHVDWATNGEEITVDAGNLGQLAAPEPTGAPTEGGIGFYASGDAAWTFEDVRLWTCIDGSPVVDDFEYPGLSAYSSGDSTANWSFVETPTAYGAGALQFQGGESADIRSFDGLRHYPKRGDRIHLDFGTYGNWNRYAMFSFGIDPSNHQHRYELEFEPAADEIRLEYSRAPQDEETIASTTARFERDEFYAVSIEWATTTDEVVVDAGSLGTLRAPVPEDAPTAGGVGFYASGDAAWVFDNVRIANWPQYFTRDDDDEHDDEQGDGDGTLLVDDFEDGDLTEYVARDGPKSNWAVVDSTASEGSRALQFQGGDGADLQSYDGLPTYPRRGDRFSFEFGTQGNWDGYGMFSFGIDDAENFQRRYEFEFEPADGEVRLQYSRGPQNEEIIGRDSFKMAEDFYYIVTVDWAASGDDIAVNVRDQSTRAEFRAPEPDGAPTDGGIGFYGSGDAAWAFDEVRILDRTEDDDASTTGISDWPTVQYDFANTGWARAGNAPTAGVTEAWSTAVSNRTPPEPAVDDGVVYASSDGGLVALDGATEGTRWTYPNGSRVGGPPSVHDGTVYCIGGDYYGHAVDANRGTRRWQVEFPDTGTVAPAVTDDTVFFGHFYGQVVAVDVATGAKRYGAGTGDIIPVEPAVADGVLYVTGNPNGGLIAVDADTGEDLWRTFEFESGWISAPTVANDTLYVGVNTDNDVRNAFYALDPADGSPRWTFDRRVESSPAVANGTIYVPTTNGRLYALDANDGSVHWQRALASGSRLGAPSVVADTVYVADADSTLFALTTSDGSDRFQYQAGYEVVGAPAVASGRLYVAGSDGRIHALEEP